MGRLSHIRHKNKQKSSFSANGFVNGIQVSFADSQTNSFINRVLGYGYSKGFVSRLGKGRGRPRDEIPVEELLSDSDINTISITLGFESRGFES
jgi:hypothetical protein